MIATWIRDRTGSYYINQAQRYVKGAIFVPQDEPIITPAAVIAGGTTSPGESPAQIIDSPEDALSEIFSFTGEHDAGDPVAVQQRLRVQITDVAWRRRLMNQPVLANHVFGGRLIADGIQPFRALESILLESQQTMIFNFFNWSNDAPSNFRMALEGRKFQASAMLNKKVTNHIDASRIRKRYLQPYWLTSNQDITVPAGGTVDAFFQNSRDNYNMLFRLMATAITTGAAGDTQEVFAFQIFDAVTERPLQNTPVTMTTGTGTSAFPFNLTTPICMDPATILRIRITNLITDQPTEIYLTFNGVAAYVGAEQMSVRPPEIAPPGAFYIGSP